MSRTLRARVAFWPGHLSHVEPRDKLREFAQVCGIDVARGTYTITQEVTACMQATAPARLARYLGERPDVVIIDGPIIRSAALREALETGRIRLLSEQRSILEDLKQGAAEATRRTGEVWK